MKKTDSGPDVRMSKYLPRGPPSRRVFSHDSERTVLRLVLRERQHMHIQYTAVHAIYTYYVYVCNQIYTRVRPQHNGDQLDCRVSNRLGDLVGSTKTWCVGSSFPVGLNSNKRRFAIMMFTFGLNTFT